jgi:hypothetical protein
LAVYTYRQWRYTRSVDQAVELDQDDFDSRIYVVAHSSYNPRAQLVEGYSQQGGRVGIVHVELNQPMVSLVLSVVAHELFHTLGATDKYGENGYCLIPEGLAEPDKQPLFPQDYVEIMSRNRPLAPRREVPLDQLEELRVGPLTAKEIGWTE